MSDFIKCALIRMARTIAQTAVATIGTAAVISDVDWRIVISASLLAGLLSLLTSVATGLPEAEYAEHIYMSHDEPDDADEEDEEEGTYDE